MTTPERDADDDRERESLDVALERRADLARERAGREPVDERAERVRRRGDAVVEVEHPNRQLGEPGEEQARRASLRHSFAGQDAVIGAQ